MLTENHYDGAYGLLYLAAVPFSSGNPDGKAIRMVGAERWPDARTVSSAVGLRWRCGATALARV
jgi:hypothetical protein